MKELTRRQIELLKQDIPLKIGILEKRIIDCVFNDLKDNVKLYTTMKELDRTKAYDLRDLNDEQLKELAEWFVSNLHKNQETGNSHNVTEFLKEWLDSRPFSFYKDKDDDYLWGFGQNSILDRCTNALTLFEPTLKIGDTFERDGFICEVKEPVKKWYMVTYNSGNTVYKRISKAHYEMLLVNYNTAPKKITDQEFIKQLEKYAK